MHQPHTHSSMDGQFSFGNFDTNSIFELGPFSKHPFNIACVALPAEHRLAPPRHPHTMARSSIPMAASMNGSSRLVSIAGPAWVIPPQKERI
jgi:hypothetical protein